MRTLVRDRNAAVPVVLIVLVVAVVAVLLAVAVAVPWMTRAENYANDPNDPPDEVVEEYGDEESPPPKWMGQFAMTVKARTSGGDVSNIEVKQGAMQLEEWDGEPWEAASMFSASWWPWSGGDEGEDSYKVTYELSMSKGRTTYEDEGEFRVYKDYDYQNIGDSKWLFFWETQEGTWQWELDVKCKGKLDHHEGSFQITPNGVIN